MGEGLRHMKALDLRAAEWAARVPAERLARIVSAVESVTITASAGKTILEEIATSGADPATLIVEHAARGGAEDLLPLVRQVIAEHGDPVREYLAGRTKAFGFLVGQVMKRSEGRAVPQAVRELLAAELAKLARG
jgi:aspartyl-tRNA(Asn)/glutamyl-tRNA(Gln) amidotransferase subunit B